MMVRDELVTDVGGRAFLVHLMEDSLSYSPGEYVGRCFILRYQDVQKVELFKPGADALYPLDEHEAEVRKLLGVHAGVAAEYCGKG